LTAAVVRLWVQGSTVVLASGGVESAALLSYWKHWDHGQELLPL
jgi:7-cyano-7-deazaguanine synthase in queuosine biosynthesis